MGTTTLTIPKRITRVEELIVVRRQEYELLQKHPAEVKELKEGKTKVIKSLADLRS